MLKHERKAKYKSASKSGDAKFSTKHKQPIHQRHLYVHSR